jgi:hypothetical protein
MLETMHFMWKPIMKLVEFLSIPHIHPKSETNLPETIFAQYSISGGQEICV